MPQYFQPLVTSLLIPLVADTGNFETVELEMGSFSFGQHQTFEKYA